MLGSGGGAGGGLGLPISMSTLLSRPTAASVLADMRAVKKRNAKEYTWPDFLEPFSVVPFKEKSGGAKASSGSKHVAHEPEPHRKEK